MPELSPDVRQRDGGYVATPDDSLTAIAQRYGLSWQELHASNPHIADPDRIMVGDRLVIPGLAADAGPQFPDPDGRTLYGTFPWIEMPVEGIGEVTASFDAYWDNVVIVFEAGTGVSVAELMRFSNRSGYSQNTGRHLRPGKRYYFAAWHKTGHNSSGDWAPSHVRVMVATNGFVVQVDDSKPGGSYGDYDYNDVIVRVVI